MDGLFFFVEIIQVISALRQFILLQNFIGRIDDPVLGNTVLCIGMQLAVLIPLE